MGGGSPDRGNGRTYAKSTDSAVSLGGGCGTLVPEDGTQHRVTALILNSHTLGWVSRFNEVHKTGGAACK